MNYELIMLPNPILVSNETPKDWDSYWIYIENDGKCDGVITKSNNPSGWFNSLHDKTNYRTIIAGRTNLPSFRFADGVGKTIGIVDVRLIAERKYPISIFHEQDINDWDRNNFIEGFESALRIAEVRFSEDDMINAFIKGQSSVDEDGVVNYSIREFTEKLKAPKRYKVELEMDDSFVVNGGLKPMGELGGKRPESMFHSQPKLTNNCYLITKIIK